MYGLSITSFLQPLNSYKAPNSSDAKQASLEFEAEKSSAFTLDLSDAAKEMMTANLSSFTRADSKVDSAEVSKSLNRLLISRNIDVSQKIEFDINENGRLIVTSDHPQKEEIEKLVNDNNVGGDVKKLLNQSYEEAVEQVQTKYQVALEEDENKDDEEKKLALMERVQYFTSQLEAASGRFSFEGGKITAAVTSMAANFSFS